MAQRGDGWRRCGLSALALSGLALGCGDDDDGDGSRGAVSTGLPPDARLSELGSSERQQLCQGFLDAIDDALQGEIELIQCELEAVGTSVGVSLSGKVSFDVALCEQRVSDCLARRADAGSAAGAPAPPLVNAECTSAAANEAQQSCDATVAQYERCWNAVITDLDDLPSLTSCAQASASLEASESMTRTGTRVPPPDCAELMQLCPQISLPGTRPVD